MLMPPSSTQKKWWMSNPPSLYLVPRMVGKRVIQPKVFIVNLERDFLSPRNFCEEMKPPPAFEFVDSKGSFDLRL